MAVPRRTISSKPLFGFCFCVKVSIIYCLGAPFAKITNGANDVANGAPGLSPIAKPNSIHSEKGKREIMKSVAIKGNAGCKQKREANN